MALYDDYYPPGTASMTSAAPPVAPTADLSLSGAVGGNASGTASVTANGAPVVWASLLLVASLLLLRGTLGGS